MLCLSCPGVVVNAAIVAGKAAKPASDGSTKIPTYIGSVSVHRGRCTVTVTPRLIAVMQRSMPWTYNASVSCGQRGHFRVDIDASKQVLQRDALHSVI